MLCPRCGQGQVQKVIIIKTREPVHLCEECDALWQNGIVVSGVGFVDFATYVIDFGLKGQWTEVYIIDE